MAEAATPEPTSGYRFSSAELRSVSLDFPTYEAAAAALFRAHVQQDVRWCEVWEVTGRSAMGPLCAYKRER